MGARTSRPGRPTVLEVAERAGVSKMTVSRVLNDSPRVSPQTRRAVEQAIEELGFVASRAAQQLGGRRLSVLALLVPDLSNPFFTEVIRGVESVATEHELTVLVGNSAERPEQERFFLEAGIALGLDGAVICPTGDRAADSIRAMQRAGIPVVLIDREVEGIDADLVAGAAARPATELTEHLLGHGHRRVAIVAGPRVASTSRHRLAGYERAIRARGIGLDPELIVHAAFTREGGERSAAALLSLRSPPTALVAANSFIAFGVIDAARARGLAVPADLAVVAFDDYEVSAGEPFVTCADQPAEELGRAATHRLLKRLAGDAALPVTLTLPTRLRIRSSCGCHD